MKLGFGADTEDKIPFDAHTRTIVKVIGGPVNFTQLAFRQTHDGPLHGKVIEIFGIDAGKFFSQQLIHQIADRRGSGGARVAPTGEGEE